MSNRAADAGGAAPYQRAIGAILAFLVIGLFVKYSELLLTFDHREFIAPQGTAISRLKQIWLSLRFSWQELALAAAFTAVVLGWQRLKPTPGRAARATLIALRIVLAAGALVSVLGIAYYALYHTHVSASDFEQLGWATKVAGSADIFQYLSIRIGLVLWLILIPAMPWLWGRLPAATARRLALLCLAVTSLGAVATWGAGRPNLAHALLEPNPVAWMALGSRAAYIDLPPIEQLSTIGASQRLYTPTERPRNVILITLESTPASSFFAYNAEASAGRRLVTTFKDEITLFEQVFSVSPNSLSALLSVMTGWTPVPDDARALEAAAAHPTLGEIFRANGRQTQFLISGPADPLIAALPNRGFDRAWNMDSDWPRKARHARITWGYDDRLLFEEAGEFLDGQRPGSQPFFLMLYASNPHHPYSSSMVPGLQDDPDPKVRHASLVHHMFELVTDLYAKLKALGLAESTAVLVYADHGEAFGEHEGNFIHSKELFRENLHVPMFLLHPRRLGLPSRIDQLGSLDDVMPTLLDLVGLPAPPGSGMSLLFGAPERTIFMLTNWGPGQVGFRDRRYFYGLSRTGYEMLFDRVADPFERHNIADEHPDILQHFRSRLERHRPSP
jgi:hypothetical protein